MASPQLQQAIDAMKALVARPVNSPQEMRSIFEELAVRPDPDIQCQPVNASGVDAEWICAPGAKDDRFVLYLHGGG
jgi:acetyl esterase/lipase